MRRYSLFLVPILAMAGTGFFSGCSGDDNSNPDGGDAALDVNKKDAPVKSDASDAAPPVTPKGTELAASDQVQIFGVTSDGFVVYADGSASNALYAVDSAGGQPPVKIAAPTSYAVGIAGKVVFVWSGLSQQQVGSLSLWTSTGSYALAAAKSAPNGGFAASTDGKHVIFTANADTAGATGDFVGANADGSGQSTLVTGVDIGSTNACRPVIGFANDVYAITATCTQTPPDGGVPSATVSSYAVPAASDAGAGWTSALLATAALNFWSTDTAGDKIMVATPALVEVVPVAGGTPTVVDATKNIDQGDWTFGTMQKSGVNVWYSTAAGDLWVADTTQTVVVPAQVQATGVKFLRSISPDQSYFMYTTNFDSQQFGGDLYLTKTIAAAPAPTTLVSTTKGALFGTTALDDFTADSTHAVYIDNLDTAAGLGDLMAMPVGGGSAKTVATGVWQNATATGTKVVYNNNCTGCSGTGGSGLAYADLYSADVTGSSSLLQAGADVPLSAGANSIYLNPARDHVIYSYSQNAPSSGVPANGGNGIYAVAIP